jgi:selenocysteine-specific elongation factor
MHRTRFDALRAAILEALEALHAAHPLETRLPRQSLLRRVRRWGDAGAEAMIDHLRAIGELAGDEGTVGLAAHAPVLTEEQRDLRERVLAAYRAAAFSPPDGAALAAALRTNETALRPVLELCAREGELVHLGGGTYLHGEAAAAARARLDEPLRTGAGLTVSEIRDALGTTRKYAVPICEYLDRVGFTRRVGDRRVLAAPSP